MFKLLTVCKNKKLKYLNITKFKHNYKSEMMYMYLNTRQIKQFK